MGKAACSQHDRHAGGLSSAGLYARERPPPQGHRRLSALDTGELTRNARHSGFALRAPWNDDGENPVNNGNSGDIGRRVVERRRRSWFNGSSYGDGKPSRRFGLQFATVPICSGCRSGCRREIGPRCRSSEIARQCGAAVRQERPSGKPGGLFLLRGSDTSSDLILRSLRSKRLEGWPRESIVAAGILRDARKSALLRIRTAIRKNFTTPSAP